MFDKYVPLMAYFEGRDIAEFFFTVPNRPGHLRKALEVFERHNANVVSIFACSDPRGIMCSVFAFVDLTSSDVRGEDIRGELKRVTGGEVVVKTPPVKGFMMEELGFPLYVLPGVRGIILHAGGIQEMIRGFYEKFGDTASVFLFHLAFSGGKYMAEHLSQMLARMRSGYGLLVELLKIFQASGWGRVELAEYDPFATKIVVKMYDSVECGAFRGSGKAMSQLVRGYISGLLSGLIGREIRLIETKCIAKGDPYCEFYAEMV